ncbi:MAG: hypothetical protein K0U45_07030 [Alphaproteobacteria bacterium]|nr:hypothetical protein [Alphaproteobacteria bacterium]
MERFFMPRRRKQNNQMGTIYMILAGISLIVIIIIYLGLIKDPRSGIDRETKRFNLEFNLEQKL